MTRTASSPPFTPADGAELRRALRELVRHSALRDRTRAAARGLTTAGAHVLEVLAERGPLSLNALAAELFVDKSTASRTVGLLEDHGHLVRRADPADGRAIRVELTPGGLALHRELHDASVREAEAVLAELSAGERVTGVAFLRRLLATPPLDAEREGGAG